MKIRVYLEKIIEISDPIHTFNEIMEQIDLYKYFAEKGSKTGRPRLCLNHSEVHNGAERIQAGKLQSIGRIS